MKAQVIFLSMAMAASSLASIPVYGGTETTIPSDSDLGRLQGRWTARAGARREVRVVLEIKGHQATASIKTPHGMRLLLEGEVSLDEKASPRRVDWIKFTGADQQEFPPLLGIYTVDHDRFTVCNGGIDRARPTEFKAGDGVLAEVVVFQRERPPTEAKAKAPGKAAAVVKK
jgi:uncharacterized protein (TIGR03067 family)